jgi:hypothetical protein
MHNIPHRYYIVSTDCEMSDMRNEKQGVGNGSLDSAVEERG